MNIAKINGNEMNINALKEVLLDQRYDFFAEKNLIERDVWLKKFEYIKILSALF